ncbi:MAG: glycosyl hydrolase family 18 protein, partial [Clostridiales bacterium]|nr:glycosyl hydrolase family 18 protein [Clostridiales bacterium]
DLGWAPASMGAGAAIEATPKGKKNLTLLLRELRAALGDGALITMACSACDSPPDIVDWAEAVKALDFINLMAHGCNIEAAVKSYAGAGCPQDKINIGCVAGAALVPAELQGPAGNLDTKWSWIGSALSASGWDAAPHDSEPAWHRVESALDGKTVGGAYGGATRRIEFHKEWDGDTGIGKVFAYDLTGDPKRAVKLPVMTYMDEQSVKARADFIIQNGLRGAFLRCYSDDTDSWLARAFSASFRKNDDPKGLPWPFTPTEWVLDKMAGIDIDEYGYGQYDDVWLVKRALGASPAECGAMGSPAASVSEDERGKFLQDDGEYSGLYQGLLDQEAQMIKLWLADLAAPRPDEDWQRHMSRIAQARQKFAETPGYYKMVEPGRRASVLGADSFANNEDGKKIIAWQKLYDRKFQSECYKPGKVVENLIRDMDPTDPAKVEAARYAYDQLDGLARSCVMNYQTLTRAEGLVNPDGSDIVRPNVAAIGMSRTAIQEGGVQAESYEPALASLRAALPGAEPLFIWASGTSGGQLAAGAAGWSELADSGCLKHPAEHYQQMGIALAEDPVGDEFFAYLDKNFPEARVYLLLANMDRLIEPQMDVLSHRAKQYGCIKGLAVDVEWYDSSLAGCGLEVSDYRARIWNEDVYSHWGEEYSLALMHSDAHHLPAVYRGGADGKSNPLVFIDSTHGYGSWDGSHGGRRSEPDAGGGADLGNGGSWAMFAEYFYPNQVIFQTGYRQDQQWMYSFEDPFMRSYVNKCAEVVAPDQEMGVAWVDSNCSGFPEFPSAGWCTQNQQLTELAARTIGYLSDYNGDNSNLLGGNWGYFTEGSGGPRRLPANAPGYYDALWVKHVRDYCNALVSLGAAPACFIGAVNYQRFLEIEPRACDILIGALPALRKIRAERDKGRVYEAYSMYAGLTEAQKA